MPTSTPKPKFPDFDFTVGQGTFWEYRWSYTDQSCAQGSGCSTKKDEGRFQVTLGSQTEIQGVTMYVVQLSGKHRVAVSDVTRDFAPRWRYLAHGRWPRSSTDEHRVGGGADVYACDDTPSGGIYDSHGVLSGYLDVEVFTVGVSSRLGGVGTDLHVPQHPVCFGVHAGDVAQLAVKAEGGQERKVQRKRARCSTAGRRAG